MPNLYEKRSRARSKFVGRRVRRTLDDALFRTCVNVNCYGPPSGWTCIYELVLEGGDDIKVERVRDIEVEEQA